MRDPATVLELVERTTEKLDAISKALAHAHDEEQLAEEAWDTIIDAVGEALIEEYREAGRKTDPAEHTIRSTARRQHRAEYQRLRRAERETEKLESLARNRRAELSAYQSELSTARAELDGMSAPQPSWSHQRRAA